MKLDWTPGQRIQLLPKPIQPFAIIARNILLAVGAIKRLKPERKELREASLTALALGVDYVYGCAVAGHIAEFGTMTGNTAAVLAREIAKASYMYPEFDPRGRHKKLFLFDSFQGLPVSDVPEDRDSPHVLDGTWSAGTCKGITKEELRMKCAKFIPNDRIAVLDGWFKDTLPTLPAGTTFALLHVDCDLYQSTLDVLDFCFQRGLVEEGAAIFFDDWNSNRASPKYGERKAWAEAVTRYEVDYSDWGEYGHMGRKFIVHAYVPGPASS